MSDTGWGASQAELNAEQKRKEQEDQGYTSKDLAGDFILPGSSAVRGLVDWIKGGDINFAPGSDAANAQNAMAQVGVGNSEDDTAKLNAQADINFDNSNSARAQQNTLAQMLADQAAGKGESVAQNLAKQNMQSLAAAQISAARSNPNLNPVMAARQAQQATDQRGIQLSQQLANLRAKEMMDGRNAYAQMLSGMRGQDLQQSGLGADVSKYNVGAGQSGYELDLRRQQGNQGASQNYMNLLLGYDQMRQNQAMAEAGHDEAQKAAMMQMVGTGVAAAASDIRVKKNIDRKHIDKDVEDMMDKLDTASYEYTDASIPGAAKGRRYGTMAQSLAASRAGKSIVLDNEPDGIKRIDTKQGFGLALAAMSNLNKRLKKLEE